MAGEAKDLAIAKMGAWARKPSVRQKTRAGSNQGK